MKTTVKISYQDQDITVEGDWVDEGIGPYEFWGDLGTHKDIQFKASDAYDENGNWIEVDEEIRERAALAADYLPFTEMCGGEE